MVFRAKPDTERLPTNERLISRGNSRSANVGENQRKAPYPYGITILAIWIQRRRYLASRHLAAGNPTCTGVSITVVWC